MSAARRRVNNLAILAVICGSVLFGRFWVAADNVTYAPEPGPPPACSLLRAELLAVVVPGGVPVETAGQTEEGFHATLCEIETNRAKLSVDIFRMGRANGFSARENLKLRWPVAQTDEVDLGNEAWLSEGTLQIRQGSYFIWIDYVTKDAADPVAKRLAVLAVGQEVLSKL